MPGDSASDVAQYNSNNSVRDPPKKRGSIDSLAVRANVLLRFRKTAQLDRNTSNVGVVGPSLQKVLRWKPWKKEKGIATWVVSSAISDLKLNSCAGDSKETSSHLHWIPY